MTCSTCGTDVFGDSVFCDSCGAIIDGSPAPQAEPTGAAFEPTQMIPVTNDEQHVPAPPVPAQQPRPGAAATPVPEAPLLRPAAPRRAPGPAFVPDQRRSTIPLVGGALLLLGVVVLAFVIRGAFSANDDVVQPPNGGEVATPAGDAAEAEGETESDEGDESESEAELDEEPVSNAAAELEIPDGFQLYEGGCFAAVVPESWTLTEDSGARSYGRRTVWARGDEILFVDTSPLRDESVTGREAADEQLENQSTATSTLIEEQGRDDMWSFTYMRSGVPSIAIYFVEERGFGIVGSSRQNPDGVLEEARQVSRSIQVTNPDC